MSSYFLRFCLGFCLTVVFRFCGCAGYLSAVARMSSYEISGRERDCIQTFISLVSAILDSRHMPFVLL